MPGMIWCSTPRFACVDFALLPDIERLPTVGTVPLCSSCGNVVQADTCKVKPFHFATLCSQVRCVHGRFYAQELATYVDIVALNHSPIAIILARAIARFVWVDRIAFVIHILLFILDLLVFALLGAWLLLRCRLSLTYSAVATAFGCLDDAGGRTFASSAWRPRLRGRGISCRASSARPIHS